MNVWGTVKKSIAGGLILSGFMLSSVSLTGCLTDDDPEDTTTTTPPADTTLVTKSTTTLGAQTNASGSSLDLDNWTVYQIDDAVDVSTKIDLIFAYSTATSSSAIYSPNIAVNGTNGSNGFDFLEDFDNPRTTEIRKTSVTYASVNSKAKLDAAWAGGTAEADGKLDITDNTVFLAKSDMGKIVLLEVSDVVTGANGKVSLSAKAKAFD